MQVHFPFPTYPQQVLADALTEIIDKGTVRAVGVCNYNVQQMQELGSILGRRGISLASNQVTLLLANTILDSSSFVSDHDVL